MRSAFLLGLSEPYEEHMEQEIDPAEMQMEHTTTGALPVEVGLGISLMMPFGEGPGSPMDAPPAVPNPQGAPEEQELFTQLSGFLTEQWGIGSRDALLLTISSLLEAAGDPEYDALRPYIQQIASLPVKERDAAEPEIIEAAMNGPQYREIPADELRAALERWMSLYTQEHTEKLIPQQLPQTLAGWDVGRAARLARIGYLVGMINLEEYLNIQTTAQAMNQQLFSEPLSTREVDQIARSIHRWITTKSRMWADGPAVYEATFSTIQSARGRKSGAVRRKAAQENWRSAL